MEKQEKQQVLPYLPLDIQEIIFLKLPIESIMKLKCLSKYYQSLLCDHGFQTKYCTLRNSGGLSSSGVVFAPVYVDEDSEKHSVYTDEDSEKHRGFYSCAYTSIESPLRYSWFCGVECNEGRKKPKLIGSWNGLVALYHGLQGFVLWNPTTGEWNSASIQGNFRKPHLLGLCYDSITNEYKVLISEYYKAFYLISFKTADAEELVDCHPPGYTCFGSKRGTIVNGIPHWTAFDHCHRDGRHLRSVVLYFDLPHKRLKPISLPSFGSERYFSGLGVLDGQLTVTLFDSYECEIWGMKQYGVVDSWTKLLVIQRPGSLSGVSRAMVPLGCLSNGDIIMDVGDNDHLRIRGNDYFYVCHGCTNGDDYFYHRRRRLWICCESESGLRAPNELMGYNPIEKTFKTVLSPPNGIRVSRVTYTPSLFSPF